jgi:hypothetical protein
MPIANPSPIAAGRLVARVPRVASGTASSIMTTAANGVAIFRCRSTRLSDASTPFARRLRIWRFSIE